MAAVLVPTDLEVELAVAGGKRACLVLLLEVRVERNFDTEDVAVYQVGQVDRRRCEWRCRVCAGTSIWRVAHAPPAVLRLYDVQGAPGKTLYG